MTARHADFYSTPTGKKALLRILQGFFDPEALNYSTHGFGVYNTAEAVEWVIENLAPVELPTGWYAALDTQAMLAVGFMLQAVFDPGYNLPLHEIVTTGYWCAAADVLPEIAEELEALIELVDYDRALIPQSV